MSAPVSQWLNVSELAAKVRSGELKAVDMVEQSLRTIANNSEYNAVIATTADRARDRARQIDAAVEASTDSDNISESLGALCGVPFIAKDNFLVFGADTTAASNILRGFAAPYQSTAIEKLEAAGAICVAKANLDAFAHGSSTENSDFMVTKNPHDTTRVPGGSSGGSAAAVVLDMVPFALGTDTGGSIRLPASYCGAVGYKPTYGLVSRSGVVAMASSLDVIGPITRTVSDAGCVLDVIAGVDPLDSTMIPREVSYLPDGTSLKGCKFGLITEYVAEGVDPEVKHLIEVSVTKLAAAGAEIVDISLPTLPAALAAYYIICPAEVSSNLNRYDGQRFGYSQLDAADLEASYSISRSVGFGKEAKRRIMIGTYVLSSGYYDAYYKKAQTVRTKIINEFATAFKDVEFLIGPTAPTVAFKIGENTVDPLQMYLTDIMTVAVNLAGIPAISVPAGAINGLPVGLQIMSAQRTDKSLLDAALSIEGVLA